MDEMLWLLSSIFLPQPAPCGPGLPLRLLHGISSAAAEIPHNQFQEARELGYLPRPQYLVPQYSAL